jgi:tRNA G46 methylase TrmB
MSLQRSQQNGRNALFVHVLGCPQRGQGKVFAAGVVMVKIFLDKHRQIVTQLLDLCPVSCFCLFVMSVPAIRPFQPQYLTVPRDFQPIANMAICLEIGAGKGKHACLFAHTHPQYPLLAIERTAEKFHAMQKTHQELGCKNLQPIHADAIPWVVHALYPAQIEQVFILYPNPEPHNPSQRWLNMPFFEYLLSRIKAGGTITLASNIAEYIIEAEQQLTTVWHLPYELQRIAEDSARTHFEVKYLQRGELCQQLIITKPQNYQTRFDNVLPRLGQHA